VTPRRLAVDLGSTNLRHAVFSEGRLHDIERTPLPALHDEDLREWAAALVRERIRADNVEEVGVAAAGVVHQDGRVLWQRFGASHPTWWDWPQITLRETVVLNDGVAAAAGELARGALRGAGRGALLVLGTGIASGLAFSETLYAAELHLTHVAHSRLQGSAGDLASGHGLEAFAALAAAEDPESRLATLLTDETASGTEIDALARAGCPAAQQALGWVAEALALAIADISMMLLLDRVVLGGPLTGAAELVATTRRALLAADGWAGIWARDYLELREAEVGDPALLGAALARPADMLSAGLPARPRL
jgi:glucokinase